MLESQSIPAGRSKDAQRRRKIAPRGQGGVEHLDKHRAHVTHDPLVEHRLQKGAPRSRIDGPVGDSVPFLEPRLVLALHDGNELDEPDPEVVPEVPVDIQRAVLVGGVDRAQDVDIDVMGGKPRQTCQHPVRRRSAPLVHPVAVVEVRWAVDADAHQELVAGQQLAPFVGQQRPVGLDRVLQVLSRSADRLGRLDGPAKEVDAHQGRLAALPGHGYLAVGLGSDVLAQVLGQQVVGHAEAVARVEGLFGQEEAVFAVEVADGARRLGQDVERDTQRRRRSAMLGRPRTQAGRPHADGCGLHVEPIRHRRAPGSRRGRHRLRRSARSARRPRSGPESHPGSRLPTARPRPT